MKLRIYGTVNYALSCTSQHSVRFMSHNVILRYLCI